MVRFPPPPKIARYVLPPPLCEFPILEFRREDPGMSRAFAGCPGPLPVFKNQVGTPSWEKESIHRPAPAQNFSLQKKNGVHRGKTSVADMVFLVFIGFLYPPPAWKVFL